MPDVSASAWCLLPAGAYTLLFSFTPGALCACWSQWSLIAALKQLSSTNFLWLQDWQFTGMQVTNCTNVNLHGPCEQTYTTDQLDFVQGTIVGVNDKDLEYTVEVLSDSLHETFSHTPAMLVTGGACTPAVLTLPDHCLR